MLDEMNPFNQKDKMKKKMVGVTCPSCPSLTYLMDIREALGTQ